MRSVFRRSRIIGRRFRLVHVMCGEETVEVSTYPRRATAADRRGAVSDEHGRILRDNVFGTQEEDARAATSRSTRCSTIRRPKRYLDFCGGVDDLKARRLRMIGDPEQRYREDPVRMLRAVRLAAKLGLEIEADTREPIKTLAPLLANVPPARLFDEMMKLLLSGHATECVLQLRQEGLHHGLLPMLDVILEQPMGERFVMMALQSTDERIATDKPVSPGFLFAALLWHEVLAAWKLAQEEGLSPMPALFKAMDQVIQVQAEKLAIPRRFGADMKEIWALQPRFWRVPGGGLTAARASAFSRRLRFPAAALRERRSGCRDRRVVGKLPARGRGNAQADAASGARAAAGAGAGASPRGGGCRTAAAAAGPGGILSAGARRRSCFRRRWAPIWTIRAQVQAGTRGAGAHSRHSRVAARSSLYRSAPVGYLDQPDFINAVAKLADDARSRAVCLTRCSSHRKPARPPAHGAAMRRARSISTCCYMPIGSSTSRA